MIAAARDRLEPTPIKTQLKQVELMTPKQCRRLLYWLELAQAAGRLNRESAPWVMARLAERVG